jgi:hypothetical protein
LASPASAQVTVIFQDNYEADGLDTVLASNSPQVGLSYDGSVYGRVGDDASVFGLGSSNTTKFVGPQVGVINSQDFWNISAADQAAITGQKVTIDFDAYVGSAVSAIVFDVTSQDPGGGGPANFGPGFDIELYSTGVLRYWSSASVEETVPGTFATDTWIPVHIVADFAAHTFDATVGAVSVTGATFYTATNPNFFERLQVSGGGGEGYYDNVSITYAGVPEPSTLLLMATSVLGLVYLRRKWK